MALTRQVATEHGATTDRHAIRVESDAAGLVGEWDAQRLARVVGNLVNNAVKYSPEGGEIVLALGTENDAEGTWAVPRVSDRGIGIPADEVPRVFERFYRATNAGRAIQGAGIGLAGARQIVEQHGGTIAVESRQGHGTTGTVRLPLVAHDAARCAAGGSIHRTHRAPA